MRTSVSSEFTFWIHKTFLPSCRTRVHVRVPCARVPFQIPWPSRERPASEIQLIVRIKRCKISIHIWSQWKIANTSACDHQVSHGLFSRFFNWHTRSLSYTSFSIHMHVSRQSFVPIADKIKIHSKSVRASQCTKSPQVDPSAPGDPTAAKLAWKLSGMQYIIMDCELDGWLIWDNLDLGMV